ncbi:hypothetical protein [Bacillus sp. SM2101]|uniref:hypothetical protein n=1 Tax=Bacillus sp. SM2101 TaxID=2805366 RepID=UPI001BDEB7FB|nr:hypothetical protein [Bacillus sp. SM2101]
MANYKASICGCNNKVTTKKESQNTLCDCCIIPLQNVCVQIMQQELDVNVVTQSGGATGIITSVKNFIIDVDDGAGNIEIVPLCLVSAIEGFMEEDFDNLSISVSVGSSGICACCEDPITIRLKSIKTAESINLLGTTLNTVTINMIGECLLKGTFDSGIPGVKFPFIAVNSTITKIRNPVA